MQGQVSRSEKNLNCGVDQIIDFGRLRSPFEGRDFPCWPFVHVRRQIANRGVDNLRVSPDNGNADRLWRMLFAARH